MELRNIHAQIIVKTSSETIRRIQKTRFDIGQRMPLAIEVQNFKTKLMTCFPFGLCTDVL
jgi:hypothetical protein